MKRYIVSLLFVGTISLYNCDGHPRLFEEEEEAKKIIEEITKGNIHKNEVLTFLKANPNFSIHHFPAWENSYCTPLTALYQLAHDDDHNLIKPFKLQLTYDQRKEGYEKLLRIGYMITPRDLYTILEVAISWIPFHFFSEVITYDFKFLQEGALKFGASFPYAALKNVEQFVNTGKNCCDTDPEIREQRKKDAEFLEEILLKKMNDHNKALKALYI